MTADASPTSRSHPQRPRTTTAQWVHGVTGRPSNPDQPEATRPTVQWRHEAALGQQMHAKRRKRADSDMKKPLPSLFSREGRGRRAMESRQGALSSVVAHDAPLDLALDEPVVGVVQVFQLD